MVQIEKMLINDLDNIKNILATDFDDFWGYDLFKGELENPRSKYIVAKDNSEIVGFAGIWDSSDDIHITNIVVKKSSRRNGIANLLLEKLIEITNGKILTLEVNENNIVAQHLYEKYNFKKLGFRRNYYKSDSAIIMTRKD